MEEHMKSLMEDRALTDGNSLTADTEDGKPMKRQTQEEKRERERDNV
jgi:hypothetical protein